ncbi:MAG: putative transposase [Candidatus Saccharimonadales bacterium]
MLEARPLAYNDVMPTKNSRKQYVAEEYYHVYSRGINKEKIFKEDADYAFFLSLFKRYLASENSISSSRVPYPNFRDTVKLNAYCLMPNHIHLLLYLIDEEGIKKLMQSVMTSYSMYFNQKYGHFGPVFQSRYLATNIDKQNYLEHISRYIHLNPKNFKDYPYSSLQYYLNVKSADWLEPNPILELFNNDADEYLRFVSDYEDHKAMLDELKYDLADC